MIFNKQTIIAIFLAGALSACQLFDGTNANPRDGSSSGSQESSASGGDDDALPPLMQWEWEFKKSSRYTYDPTKIEFVDGVAKLILAGLPQADQTDDDDSSEGFGGGTHSDTRWTSSSVALNATGMSNGSGVFTSRVMDGISAVSWTSISWAPFAPYRKELPDSDGVESGYTDGNIDMTDNVILFHFNENAGATSFTDGSGNSHDGDCTNCPTMGGAGLINGAADFSGTNEVIKIPNHAELNSGGPYTDRTIGLWFKATSPLSGRQVLFEEGGGTRGFNIYLDGNTLYGGGWNRSDYSPQWTGDWMSTTVNADEWTHVMIRLSGAGSSYPNGNFTMFVDGAEVEAGGRDAAQLHGHSGDISIGTGTDSRYHDGTGGSHYYDGLIDEFTMFNRALLDTEVGDHYRRGALDLRIQVRSCDDAACDTEQFVGPDGTPATSFSDLSNSSTSPLGPQDISGVIDNQYFQYQVTMETLDSTETPELLVVDIGPAHFAASDATLVNNYGAQFSRFDTYSVLVHTPGPNHEGSFAYQISHNGSDWFYHDGTQWTGATTETNSIVDISANLKTFDDEIGIGKFYYKVFFLSNGSQQVELDHLRLGLYKE